MSNFTVSDKKEIIKTLIAFIILIIFTYILSHYWVFNGSNLQPIGNTGSTSSWIINSIPLCDSSEFKVSEWGICSQSWSQERTIIRLSDRAINWACRIDSLVQQNCTVPVTTNKRVSLFPARGYITKIDLTQKHDLEYTVNNKNLSITLNWQIETLTLEFTALTTVLDGRTIQRDSPYYAMFAINDLIPRILGTERIYNGNISEQGYGVFNGLDTPKLLKFDLSKVQLALAKNPYEGIWSKEEDYVKILNKNSWKSLPMTLYIGWSGKWMLMEDEKMRIFWKIREAYLEYKCKEWSDCSIQIQ